MLNATFKSSRVIKIISYSIDICVLSCVIIKYTCVAIAARDDYTGESLNWKVRMAYYSSTMIQQGFQIFAFVMSTIILYKIVTILSERPVC